MFNRLIGEGGCSVRLEESRSTTSPDVTKHMSTKLLLGALDPKSVVTRAYNEVTFERTDSAMKNQSDVEMGDGRHTQGEGNRGSLFFDTEESAQRFARALSHAITECGGSSAPF